jgi:hypothetical protein
MPQTLFLCGSMIIPVLIWADNLILKGCSFAFAFNRRILASAGYGWFNYRDLGPKQHAAFTAHIKQLN